LRIRNCFQVVVMLLLVDGTW